jgi:hypothetical protein
MAKKPTKKIKPKPMTQGQETVYLAKHTHRTAIDTNRRVQHIEYNTTPKGYLAAFDFTFALISVMLSQALIGLDTALSIYGLWLFGIGIGIFLLLLIPNTNKKPYRSFFAAAQILVSIFALLLYWGSANEYLGG